MRRLPRGGAYAPLTSQAMVSRTADAPIGVWPRSARTRLAVVSAAGLTDTILVGHSMGADVILEAARLMQVRVRGLVWVDQYKQLSTFMSEARVQERIAPFRARFTETTRTFIQRTFSSRSDSSLIERVAAQISSAPESMALAVLEATWNHGRSVPGLLA